MGLEMVLRHPFLNHMDPFLTNFNDFGPGFGRSSRLGPDTVSGPGPDPGPGPRLGPELARIMDLVFFDQVLHSNLDLNQVRAWF